MTSAGRFRIAADHPSLAGHFPGRPIVPGVVLLDQVFGIVAQAYPGRRVAGLPAVKFMVPVRPEQEVEVHLQAAPDRIGVLCTAAGHEVLRGTLVLAA